MRILFATIALIVSLDAHGALFFGNQTAQVLRPQPNTSIPIATSGLTPQNFSWSFWLNRLTTNSGGLLGVNVSAANKRMWGFYFSGTKSNSLTFFYLSSGAVLQEFTTEPGSFGDTNNWHHVAFTFTYGTTASAKFYLDGLPIAGAWTAGDGTPAAAQTGVPYTIGVDKGISGGFLGALTDVCVYNSQIITAQQVFTLARSRLKQLPAFTLPTTYAGGNVSISQCFFQFDELPAFTTQSGTNLLIERSGFTRPGGTTLSDGTLRNPGSLGSNVVIWPERVTSYYPNE